MSLNSYTVVNTFIMSITPLEIENMILDFHGDLNLTEPAFTNILEEQRQWIPSRATIESKPYLADIKQMTRVKDVIVGMDVELLAWYVYVPNGKSINFCPIYENGRFTGELEWTDTRPDVNNEISYESMDTTRVLAPMQLKYGRWYRTTTLEAIDLKRRHALKRRMDKESLFEPQAKRRRLNAVFPLPKVIEAIIGDHWTPAPVMDRLHAELKTVMRLPMQNFYQSHHVQCSAMYRSESFVGVPYNFIEITIDHEGELLTKMEGGPNSFLVTNQFMKTHYVRWADGRFHFEDELDEMEL